MRTFALLLFLPAAGLAWQLATFPTFGRDDRPLRDYLEVTDAQWAAISQADLPGYWTARRSLDDRQQQLLAEIRTETNRSPLRPPDLGRLHAEWEQNRRQLLQWEDRLRETRLAFLTSAQREKLRLIERTRLLAPIASNNDLIQPDCTSGLAFLGTPVLPVFNPTVSPNCQPPPVPAINYLDSRTGSSPRDALVRFLDLAPAQAERFSQNQIEIFLNSEILRMHTVALEILEETARPELDPLALGLRYAELESLRRNYSERVRRLEAANRAVLTPAQRDRLAILEEATRLRATAAEANFASLIGRRCQSQGIFVIDPTFPSFSSLNFFGLFAGDCPNTDALDQLPYLALVDD